jgi:hypothetical protein
MPSAHPSPVNWHPKWLDRWATAKATCVSKLRRRICRFGVVDLSIEWPKLRKFPGIQQLPWVAVLQAPLLNPWQVSEIRFGSVEHVVNEAYLSFQPTVLASSATALEPSLPPLGCQMSTT